MGALGGLIARGGDYDGVFELFLMAYDDPWGGNTFRYRVVEP